MWIRLSSLLAVVALSSCLSAKSEPAERPNPSIDPPKIVQAPLEPAIVESLSALVEEMKASRREQRIIEERWWPPSARWAIVYATVLFMTVAAFQIRALVRQARIAAQTLGAIRKHLAVSDRAKIPYEPIIQSMKLHKFGHPDFCVTYQIMNTGRTEAHVFEQQSLVWWDDGSTLATHRESGFQPVNYNIAPGQQSATTTKPFHCVSDEERSKVGGDRLQIYVSGCIRYRDASTEYRTQFACRCESTTAPGKFVMVSEPGYNLVT